MGQYLVWLGFRLPPSVWEAQGSHDAFPIPAFCHLCRRPSVRAYLRHDGFRVCSTCIVETLRVIGKERRMEYRRLPEHPSEPMGGGPRLDPGIWGQIA